MPNHINSNYERNTYWHFPSFLSLVIDNYCYCFWYHYFLQKKKSLLIEVLEIKDKEGFHQSIKTGVIPEELLDEIEPESVYIIRRIYVLTFQTKVLIGIFILLFFITTIRFLLLEIQ